VRAAIPLPRAFWLLAAAILFIAPARAQTPTIPSGSGKLAAVEVSGSKRFPAEQIAAATGLRVGASVQRDDFQAAADRLAELGLFSNVRFRFSQQGASVKAEFQVEDTPALPVEFDNFPWFTDEELTQAVHRAIPLFDGTAPANGTVLDAIASALTKILGTRNVKGSVEHALVTSPGSDSQFQRFTLIGAALKVSAVDFTDALARTVPGLQDRLSDLVGKPYSRYSVEVFEVEQVRPIYFEHARLAVRFDRPRARFAGDPNRPLPDSVVVIVPIEPGPVYTWGGVAWTGNSALSPASLDKLIPLHAGDPADGMKILGAWERVRAAYGQQGYIESKVQPVVQLDDTSRRASYQVAITEGPQYHMGDLVLTGLSLEGERRIRAAWRIAKGQVFDQTYFDAFIEKGAKEAFGDLPFHYDQIGRFLRTDPKSATVDVLLDFR
jgi:outer membrane protein assembly factor BamA